MTGGSMRRRWSVGTHVESWLHVISQLHLPANVHLCPGASDLQLGNVALIHEWNGHEGCGIVVV